jgi:hypothetical protein
MDKEPTPRERVAGIICNATGYRSGPHLHTADAILALLTDEAAVERAARALAEQATKRSRMVNAEQWIERNWRFYAPSARAALHAAYGEPK